MVVASENGILFRSLGSRCGCTSLAARLRRDAGERAGAGRLPVRGTVGRSTAGPAAGRITRTSTATRRGFRPGGALSLQRSDVSALHTGERHERAAPTRGAWFPVRGGMVDGGDRGHGHAWAVSYTHLRAHETRHDL